MPQWKQFGDVILNLDRVVKVERRGDAVKVYMAGLLPRPRAAAWAPRTPRRARGPSAATRPGGCGNTSTA